MGVDVEGKASLVALNPGRLDESLAALGLTSLFGAAALACAVEADAARAFARREAARDEAELDDDELLEPLGGMIGGGKKGKVRGAD